MEICVAVEREAVESVAEVFARYGQGVAVHEPVRSSKDGEDVTIDPAAPVSVVTHIPLDQHTEHRRAAIEDAVWHLAQLRSIGTVASRSVSDREWADAWKRYFSVHRIGARVIIVPSWRRYRPTGQDIVVRLDPGMAFGTGLHPTTRLCIVALEELVQPDQRVLDLGCGSGILSIAAAKLGAGQVLAIDVEPIAVEVAASNVRRNRVARAVRVREGMIEQATDGAPFDLVVANISFRVLSALAEDVAKLVAPGGIALLSGVLEERVDELLTIWSRASWQLRARAHEADWATVQLSRP